MLIGEYLVSKGMLKTSEVTAIVEYGRLNSLRFGEAAMQMGKLDDRDMIKVFGPHFRTDFFYLDPAYFPLTTKDLISTDLILKYGILPLGLKRERHFFSDNTRLNVGMINPSDREALERVSTYLQGKKAAGFSRFKVYLILADQFLRIIESVYGISEAMIHDIAEEEVDNTLLMFLER